MRRVGRHLRTILLASALAAPSACRLDVTDPQAQVCTKDEECPSDGNRRFRCVPNGAGASVCEIRFPYTGLPGDGDPTYCTDIKPLMATYCVSCHAPESNSSGKAFSLSHYETQNLPGGVAREGVYDTREMTKIRMIDKMPLPMPPSGFPQPTADELELLAKWVDSGAPYAEESPSFDAAVNCDAGATQAVSGLHSQEALNK